MKRAAEVRCCSRVHQCFCYTCRRGSSCASGHTVSDRGTGKQACSCMWMLQEDCPSGAKGKGQWQTGAGERGQRGPCRRRLRDRAAVGRAWRARWGFLVPWVRATRRPCRRLGAGAACCGGRQFRSAGQARRARADTGKDTMLYKMPREEVAQRSSRVTSYN